MNSVELDGLKKLLNVYFNDSTTTSVGQCIGLVGAFFYRRMDIVRWRNANKQSQ